ncbi:Uncharacterized protein APZ42_027906 [Daphnia magna]|uniref:Uncharacterized protein n=1 Tax=Daphnia magna TaxID=35525 RepID=A0A164QYY0_9CRUS|nr:Uncharacterized protein APZ42_027906 [Daphnia magna]
MAILIIRLFVDVGIKRIVARSSKAADLAKQILSRYLPSPCPTSLTSHLFRDVVYITELQNVTPQKDKTILDTIPDFGPTVRHREERYLHNTLSREVKELSIHFETLLLAYQQTFLVDIHNLILYLQELHVLTPLEPLVSEINALLRKLDSHEQQPEQHTTDTIPTVEYRGRGTTATRGPTASTAAGRNSQLTTETDVIRRPHSNRRPYCGESRLSTSSISDQSQNSRQENLRFQSADPNSNMAHCSFPSRAEIIRDLDDLKKISILFNRRLQLLPSFTGNPIPRFDSWLESFQSIVDRSGWSEQKTIQMLHARSCRKSFAIILMQKFFEGLDSKLQSKVKYKELIDFNELVAETTRVYASSNAELKEIKQMMIDQKEMVIKVVANIPNEDISVGEKKTESEQIRDVLIALVQSVKKLHLNGKDVSYPSNTSYKKEVSFQMPNANRKVRIPRNTKLDIIEIIHLVIGKISLDQPEARPNETIKSIVISEVNPEFQAPPSKIRTKFIQKDDAQFDSAHIEQLTTKGNY